MHLSHVTRVQRLFMCYVCCAFVVSGKIYPSSTPKYHAGNSRSHANLLTQILSPKCYVQTYPVIQRSKHKHIKPPANLPTQNTKHTHIHTHTHTVWIGLYKRVCQRECANAKSQRSRKKSFHLKHVHSLCEWKIHAACTVPLMIQATQSVFHTTYTQYTVAMQGTCRLWSFFFLCSHLKLPFLWRIAGSLLQFRFCVKFY